MYEDCKDEDKQYPIFFQFDVSWLQDINNIPITDWLSDVYSSNYQHIGINKYNEGVWKHKYFISDPIHVQYINHIRANSVYFLSQPNYYRGMFDILN